jgi:magnesium transporter
MLTTIKHKKITWVNLHSPSAKEVSDLAKKFPIHPLVAEELISPTLRPKVDAYKDNIYLILHFPVYNPVTKANKNIEIDFVIGKNFLITAQYGALTPFETFIKESKSKKSFRDMYFKENAGYLVYHILKELYEFSLRQLDHIHMKINKVEDLRKKKWSKKYHLSKEMSSISGEHFFLTTVY